MSEHDQPLIPEIDADRPASAPDRNLALELVRVTEAGALAAGRWVGRGDKNSADGAAVDAMRLMLDTVSMDGVVVIGEGEKDEAPMLFNGEEVGNGQGPQRGRGRRPAGGDPAHRAGDAERHLGGGGRRARHHVLPRRRGVHGQDRRRPGGGRRHRHRGPARGERPPGGQGQGGASPRTSRSSSWTATGTRTSSPRSARSGAKVYPDHRRRRRPGHRRGRAGAPAWTC